MSQPTQQTQQTQTAPPPVDGADESDFNAMEVALGAAIAALIIAWLLPGPPSLLGNTARFRKQQIEASLGWTLRMFVQRSAVGLAAASGQTGAYSEAADVAEDVYQHVLHRAETWIEQSYQRLKGRIDPTESDTYARTGEGQTELRGLADQAASNDAIAIASYARNEARDETAGRIGALWSEWVSRHDDRVRTTHRELDGAKVPYGGRFVVADGAAYLRYPGDPEGPPSETMGCRCHLRYRFRPKDTSFAEV